MNSNIENLEGALAGGGRSATTELAMRRTDLGFQRTRIAGDRTLMAVIRTSLSLISFGFTIFTFFRSMHQAELVKDVAARAARNFGIALNLTGIILLVLGLIFHVRFMQSLRKERNHLIAESMLYGELPYPVSLTTIIAVVLLGIGIVSLVSVVLREIYGV